MTGGLRMDLLMDCPRCGSATEVVAAEHMVCCKVCPLAVQDNELLMSDLVMVWNAMVITQREPLHHAEASQFLKDVERLERESKTAPDYLDSASAEMKDREATYDSPGGERSIPKTVAAFNTIYDKDLTEEEGWQFMTLLKKVRSTQGAYKEDNYVDDVAYAALAAEAAASKEKV